MGIDVYLRWEGQTDAEKEAQYTGYSTINAGGVGYLREGYGLNSDYSATRILVAEAFDDEEKPSLGIVLVNIDGLELLHLPAQLMKDRLEGAAITAMNRYPNNVNARDMAVRSLEEFVALAERLEGQGKSTGVYVSW